MMSQGFLANQGSFLHPLMTRKITKHARFQPNPKILAVCEVSFQPSGTT